MRLESQHRRRQITPHSAFDLRAWWLSDHTFPLVMKTLTIPQPQPLTPNHEVDNASPEWARVPSAVWALAFGRKPYIELLWLLAWHNTLVVLGIGSFAGRCHIQIKVVFFCTWDLEKKKKKRECLLLNSGWLAPPQARRQSASAWEGTWKDVSRPWHTF